MWRTIGLIGLPLLLVANPALALTAKEKMETCKFGADDQKLDGAKRNAFIKKCMGHANYQPQARKDALKASKKKPAPKTTAAAPKPATPAAPPPPATTQQ
jgi:psiF repeat